MQESSAELTRANVVRGGHGRSRAVQPAAVEVTSTVQVHWLIHVEMHGVVTFNAEEFFKRLDDEDDGDKSGKALLGKPGDVLD